MVEWDERLGRRMLCSEAPDVEKYCGGAAIELDWAASRSRRWKLLAMLLGRVNRTTSRAGIYVQTSQMVFIIEYDM